MAGSESATMSCLPCHAYLDPDGWLAERQREEYLSPLEIEVSPSGDRLYVTAEEAGSLLAVDAASGAVVDRIAVGRQPNGIALSRDGRIAFVSDRRADNVAVVDLVSGSVTAWIPVGAAPAGVAISGDESRLFVANSVSNDVSIVDIDGEREIRRLAAGQSPYAVGVAPDGASVFVTNRLSNPVPHRTPPVSEVTQVDAWSGRVSRRLAFPSAHIIEAVDFTPSGDLALVTLTRPKNLMPATQIARGWMLTFGIGVIERRDNGRTAQLLLDDPNAFYADPYDVVVSPDGKRAFVSHSAADMVTVVDLDSLRAVLAESSDDQLARWANHLGVSSRYVVARIPTGANPKGLAVSPDGDRLYVAERLDDAIAVIDVARLSVVGRIDLGGPDEDTRLRRGQRLFHSADHTFQGQFSCRTCHPEGHHDALTYDLEPDGLGLNIVNNLSLRNLATTAPYKWTGKNASLYRQCGFRFAKWLTRTEPYTQDELYSLVAYILSLEHLPNRFRNGSGELTPAQLRGRAIFERAVTNDGRPIPVDNRCVTCHAPPRFTNQQRFDVGSAAPTDTETEFDTPRLDNLYDMGPYLHDGRALTLEEIWTRLDGRDRHGVVNDLTKVQLNDLIEYLKSLGGRRTGEGD